MTLQTREREIVLMADPKADRAKAKYVSVRFGLKRNGETWATRNSANRCQGTAMKTARFTADSLGKNLLIES